MCFVSVIIYAIFEVIYKKFEYLLDGSTEPPNLEAATASEAEDTLAGDEPHATRGRRATTEVSLKSTDELVADLHHQDDSMPVAVKAGGDTRGTAAAVAAEESFDVLTPIMACLKFLGLMGLYTLVSIGPFVWILDVTGVQKFVSPFQPGGGISCFSYIIIDGMLDMAYNICLLVGISLTSPRFMSAGTILIIPVGVVVDIVQYPGMVWNPWAILGAVTILCSFVVMEFLEGNNEKIFGRKKKVCAAVASAYTALQDEEDPIVKAGSST